MVTMNDDSIAILLEAAEETAHEWEKDIDHAISEWETTMSIAGKSVSSDDDLPAVQLSPIRGRQLSRERCGYNGKWSIRYTMRRLAADILLTVCLVHSETPSSSLVSPPPTSRAPSPISMSPSRSEMRASPGRSTHGGDEPSASEHHRQQQPHQISAGGVPTDTVDIESVAIGSARDLAAVLNRPLQQEGRRNSSKARKPSPRPRFPKQKDNAAVATQGNKHRILCKQGSLASSLSRNWHLLISKLVMTKQPPCFSFSCSRQEWDLEVDQLPRDSRSYARPRPQPVPRFCYRRMECSHSFPASGPSSDAPGPDIHSNASSKC